MTDETTTAHSYDGLFSLTSLKRAGHALLDLIFPPRCVHCGRVDHAFCTQCIIDFEHLALDDIKLELEPLHVIVSTSNHQGIALSAVQALKYHNVRRMAQPIAKRLKNALDTQTWTFDMIVPVPMHIARLRERGYNQAQEIAQALADLCDKPYEAQAIRRDRHTRSQVGLGRAERLQNVADAFTANEKLVTGKTLLLVDDVRTTGSTLIACASAALAAGASDVYAITVTAALD